MIRRPRRDRRRHENPAFLAHPRPHPHRRKRQHRPERGSQRIETGRITPVLQPLRVLRVLRGEYVGKNCKIQRIETGRISPRRARRDTKDGI